MHINSMENKPDAKHKTIKNERSQNDEFILNLVDVNASFDLKDSGDK